MLKRKKIETFSRELGTQTKNIIDKIKNLVHVLSPGDIHLNKVSQNKNIGYIEGIGNI